MRSNLATSLSGAEETARVDVEDEVLRSATGAGSAKAVPDSARAKPESVKTRPVVMMRLTNISITLLFMSCT
jgi:hypothetical protein